MKKTKWLAYIFLLPLLGIILLICMAFFHMLLQSLGYIPAFGLNSFSFSYFMEVLNNPAFLQSFGVSLWIASSSALLAVCFGTLLCLALVGLSSKKRGIVYIMRLPIVVPHMVVALFVIMLFSQTGFFSRIAYEFGYIQDYTSFPQLLFTPSYTGVIFAYLWKEIPFVAYFTLSLMSTIHKNMGEAAENLGASPWKSFFSITLPLSLPALSKAFIIIFIFAFGGYELPLLLGVTLPKALPVQAYFAYTQPDLLQRPYAVAIYILILLFCLLVAFLWHMGTKKLLSRMGVL